MSEKTFGRIIKAVSGFYYVDNGNGLIECRGRGIMRKNGVTPLVGDTVSITYDGNTGTVDGIVDRRNFLLRPPVANVDSLYIVSAYSNPTPNTLVIDKQICICERAGITPVIVFNKSDEGDLTEYELIYRNAGYRTYVISCKSMSGIDAVKADLPQGISVFTGNSGVGKSTLLNCISSEVNVKTGEVSDKLGRGRHTTRHTELYDIGNGRYIADTPGFSAIECDPIPKGDLAELFIEFSEYLGQCRFTTCSHVCEKGCAVLEAVAEGKISQSRHESYCAMYRDAAQIKSWELKK